MAFFAAICSAYSTVFWVFFFLSKARKNCAAVQSSTQTVLSVFVFCLAKQTASAIQIWWHDEDGFLAVFVFLFFRFLAHLDQTAVGEMYISPNLRSAALEEVMLPHCILTELHYRTNAILSFSVECICVWGVGSCFWNLQGLREIMCSCRQERCVNLVHALCFVQL